MSTHADSITGQYTAPGFGDTANVSGIPLLDLNELAADVLAKDGNALEKLNYACREVGFFALVNHQVDLGLMAQMRAISQDWFAQTETEKRQLLVQQQNYRGFIPLGMFTPNQDPGQDDRYEGYKLHYEVAADDPVCRANDLYGPNRWPENMPEFRTVIERYWSAMEGISATLLACFANLLNLPAVDLQALFDKPLTNMTLLHYPPTEEANKVGIHPHKDTDVFTLLYPDAVGGLQLRTRDGIWINASGPEEALIVNVGNMLETWSGGRFLSTPHRVVNQTGLERYSFPYFAVPRHDVMIEPLVEPLPDFSWVRGLFLRRFGARTGRISCRVIRPFSLAVWRYKPFLIKEPMNHASTLRCRLLNHMLSNQQPFSCTDILHRISRHCLTCVRCISRFKVSL